MIGNGKPEGKSRSLLALVAFVAMLIMLATFFAAYFYFREVPSVPSAPSETQSAKVGGALVTATPKPSGLELLLMLNATHLVTGQAVNATAEVRNSSPNVNDVSQAWVWAIPSLEDWMINLGGCPSFLSVQYYSGHYTNSNISAAMTLQASPARFVACGPGISQDGFFRFQPSSDRAFLNPCSSCTGRGYPMNQTIVTKGYYPRYQSSNFTLFPPGNYTVAAGDEWGEVAIAYFSVIAN